MDHHVDAAETGFDGVEELAHRMRIGHIGLQRDGLRAGGVQFGRQGFGVVAAARIVDRDRVAIGGEPTRDGGTDATGSAGDQGDRAGGGEGHGDFHGDTPKWRSAIFAKSRFRIILHNPPTSSG